MFRNLRADEIECRVQIMKQTGCSLLLYKDARCDMNILDETVGEMNWQRRHLRDNANCVVSIWDKEKKMWIEKEDTGVESNTESEKGLASDSFKRACFNWGIGRELYTAPFIWINLEPSEVITRNGKYKLAAGVKFNVAYIKTKDKVITDLKITDNKGVIRFATDGKVQNAVLNQNKPKKKDGHPYKPERIKKGLQKAAEKNQEPLTEETRKKLQPKLNTCVGGDGRQEAIFMYLFGKIKDLTEGEGEALNKWLKVYKDGEEWKPVDYVLTEVEDIINEVM